MLFQLEKPEQNVPVCIGVVIEGVFIWSPLRSIERGLGDRIQVTYPFDVLDTSLALLSNRLREYVIIRCSHASFTLFTC